MSANAQMDSKKLFQFHRPKHDEQPSPFIVVATPPDQRAIREAARYQRKLELQRIRGVEAILAPMAKSSFNCAIATPAQSDRTNSISRSL